MTTNSADQSRPVAAPQTHTLALLIGDDRASARAASRRRAAPWREDRPARDNEAGRELALPPDPALRCSHQHRWRFSGRRGSVGHAVLRGRSQSLPRGRRLFSPSRDLGPAQARQTMRLDPIAGSGDAPKRHSEPPPARQAVLDARRKELAEQIAALCAANAAYAEHVCTFGRVLRGGLLRPSLLPDPLHSDDVACRNLAPTLPLAQYAPRSRHHAPPTPAEPQRSRYGRLLAQREVGNRSA